MDTENEKESNPDQNETTDSGRLHKLVSNFGINSWTELLEMVESLNPPEEQSCDSENWCANVTFEHEKGWKFIIFYDCGEIDYIDHIVNPDGEEVDFWGWPEDHPWRSYLINWRGVGDLKRLLDC